MRFVLITAVAALLLAPAAKADIVELVPDAYCIGADDDFMPLRVEHELYWDDGGHCGYYHGSPDYRATTFTAPYNCKVTAIKIKWYGDEAPLRSADFDIYCDDDGEPGTGLLSGHYTSTFHSAC